jgi:hypothetical protein
MIFEMVVSVGLHQRKLLRKIRIWLHVVQIDNVFLNVFVNRVKNISLQEWDMIVDDNSK